MQQLLCYLDPAAISVLATSLTAAFVAIAASLVIYWRKLKNKFKKKNDADKDKNAEEDIRILDESVLQDDAEQAAPASEDQPASGAQADSEQPEGDKKGSKKKK